uniref:IF rod domain-containing protein n=1 Tax=Oncorhynchus mykiss TaxID=8022 RepID=A0A8C7PSH0_ONCMY
LDIMCKSCKAPQGLSARPAASLSSSGFHSQPWTTSQRRRQAYSQTPSADSLEIFNGDMTRRNEKEILQTLNDRFAGYIDKVRNLELMNSNLEQEAAALRQSQTGRATVGEHYERELGNLRGLVQQLTGEKACALLEQDHLEEDIQHVRTRLEDEARSREELEAKARLMNKYVDESGLARLELDKKLSALQEEAAFLKKNHEEEVAELLAQIQGAQVSFEARDTIKADVTNALREIRAQLDGHATKSATHAEEWFKVRMERLADAAHSNTDAIRGAQDEIAEYRRQLQSRTIELETLRGTKDSLERQCMETEDRHHGDIHSLQETIRQLDGELKSTKWEMARWDVLFYCIDTHNSDCTSCVLPLNRKLLEGEETRFIPGPSLYSYSSAHLKLKGEELSDTVILEEQTDETQVTEVTEEAEDEEEEKGEETEKEEEEEEEEGEKEEEEDETKAEAEEGEGKGVEDKGEEEEEAGEEKEDEKSKSPEKAASSPSKSPQSPPKTPQPKSPAPKSPESKSPLPKSPESKSPLPKSPAKSPAPKSPESKSPQAKSPLPKSPESKSPPPKSPLPKSPEPKSPIQEKAKPPAEDKLAKQEKKEKEQPQPVKEEKKQEPEPKEKEKCESQPKEEKVEEKTDKPDPKESKPDENPKKTETPTPAPPAATPAKPAEEKPAPAKESHSPAKREEEKQAKTDDTPQVEVKPAPKESPQKTESTKEKKAEPKEEVKKEDKKEDKKEASKASDSKEAKDTKEVGKAEKAKKSSGPEVKDEKSSSTEVKDEKSSSTEVKDEKSSSTEVKDEKSSSTEVKDEKSSSTEVKDEKSSSTEVKDEKSSSTEVKDEKAKK